MTAEARLIARIGIPMQSRFFEVGGRKLHCVVAGSGPPLVLVHGLNIGWGEWYAVLPELVKRHTVYAIDLPGAGASEKVDFLSVDVAALLTEAVDGALRALVPSGATVVGHSLGAWAVLKLAARKHPSIKAVAAVDPVGFTDFVPFGFRPLALRPLARLLAAKAVPPTRSGLTAFMTGVMRSGTAMAQEYADYFFEHVTRPPLTHPFMLIHRLFRPFRFRPEFVLTPEELSAIDRPVTIIHGAEDPLIPLDRVRQAFGRLSGARVAVLEGVGHVPPIERPETFIASLTGIL
jgi:pimeloyl-ACP methyl ester carboxylesterase